MIQAGPVEWKTEIFAMPKIPELEYAQEDGSTNGWMENPLISLVWHWEFLPVTINMEMKKLAYFSARAERQAISYPVKGMFGSF